MYGQDDPRQPAINRRSLAARRWLCVSVLVAQAASTVSGAQLTERLKLTASDAAETDYFGVSAAVSGSTAIVGAHADDDSRGGAGSAYLFDVATGEELLKLRASGPGRAGDFGS